MRRGIPGNCGSTAEPWRFFVLCLTIFGTGSGSAAPAEPCPPVKEDSCLAASRFDSGLAALNTGLSRKAQGSFAHARALFLDLGDSADAAYCRLAEALAWRRMGHPETGHPLLVENARYYQSRGGDQYAATWAEIGEDWLRRAELDSALAAFAETRAALPRCRESERERIAARMLIGVGAALRIRGDLRGARDTLESAMDRARRARDSSLWSMAANNLARTYQEMEWLDSAATSLDLALKLKLSLRPEPSGLSNHRKSLAMAYNNCGYNLQLQGKLDASEGLLRKSLGLSTQMGDVPLQAITHFNLGRGRLLQADRGSLRKGREHIEHGLALLEGPHADKTVLSWGLQDLARYHRLRGDFKAALRAYGRALKVLESLGDSPRMAGCLFAMAQILHRDLGEGRKAVENYRLAAESREKTWAKEKEDRYGLPLLERDSSLYEEWARAHLGLDGPGGRRGSILRAWQVLERGKARGLLEMLRGKRPVIGPPKEDLVGFEDRLLSAAADGVLLDFLTARDSLLVFYADSSGAVDVRALGIASDSLKALIAAGRSELGILERNAECMPVGRPPIRAPLLTLSDLLPPALRTGGGRPKELLLVPHGPLHMLPFGALQVSGRDRFLGAAVPIRLAPSLALLSAEPDSVPPGYPADHGVPGSVLAYSGGTTLSCNRRIRMPEAKGQLGLARWLADTLGLPPLIQDSATESRAMLSLPSARILHFGAHGNASSSRRLAREESFILLASDSLQDGRLTAGEIIDAFPGNGLYLRAKLVVLGACETGLGHGWKLEGVEGMTRAFLAAKAGSVISSLGALNDTASAIILKDFYKIWLSGKGKVSISRALWSAQAKYRENHPDAVLEDWALIYHHGGA